MTTLARVTVRSFREHLRPEGRHSFPLLVTDRGRGAFLMHRVVLALEARVPPLFRESQENNGKQPAVIISSRQVIRRITNVHAARLQVHLTTSPSLRVRSRGRRHRKGDRGTSRDTSSPCLPGGDEHRRDPSHRSGATWQRRYDMLTLIATSPSPLSNDITVFNDLVTASSTLATG